MGEISREEFARLYTTLDQGFKDVNARLDLINGRILDHATKISANTTRLEAIEGDQKSGALLSGGVATLIVGVVEGVRWVLGK